MSLGNGAYQPLVSHGPNDRGAFVVVVTFSLMFITILFTLIRAWATHSHKIATESDGVAICIATLLLIVESTLTERAVNYGLGRHISDILASRLDRYYKYEYAAQILGIFCQSSAKCAVVLLVERIAKDLSTKKRSFVLKSAIGIWTCFSIFTIAFQCGTNRPWEFTYDRCAAHGKLLYAIIAGDVVTDGVLACYIIPTILKLQMSRHKKLAASSIFMARLAVCAVSLGYIALVPEYLSSNDKPWHNAHVQIVHQTVVNLSVITAGLPGVRQYLSELQTGRMGIDVDELGIEMMTRNSGSRGAKGLRTTCNQHAFKANDEHLIQGVHMPSDSTTRYTTHITGGQTRDVTDGGTVNDEDFNGDDKSTSSLVNNGVFQRRDFEIRIEYSGQERK